MPTHPSITPLRVLRHACGWVLGYMILVIVLTPGAEFPEARALRRMLPQLVAIFLLVGLNVGVLLPRLYFSERRVTYWVALIGILVLASLFFTFTEVPRFGLRPRRGGLAIFRYLFPLMGTLLGSTVVEVMRYAKGQEQQRLRAEREQLATEVKFLKSQVNPHFLFNSLNNIYTLTLLRDDKAPDSLLRLSDMLRYMIYETEADTVPLSKELTYLRNYVELQQLRDSRGLNVKLELDESKPHLPIAPMLLIPFVENAFKHGRIASSLVGYIRVRLICQEQRLVFSVTNDYNERGGPTDGVGGIGLVNVRKRLDLLYPGRHNLNISGDGSTFIAHLKITLV